MVDKTPSEITPGTANDSSVVHASDATQSDFSRSHTEREISRLQSAALVYSDIKSYEIGDFVIESSKFYRCIVTVSIPETFNPAKWVLVGGDPQTPWLSDIDGDTFNLLNAGFHELNEITEPTTPAASLLRLWAESDSGLSILKYKGSDGQVNTLLQDDLVIARNTTGVTILEGSVVYFTGSNGNKITIDLAKADVSATMPSIGFALQDIPNNTNGTVMLRGRITDVDTSAFSAGDILYVSETTAGALTNTEPTHPNLAQVIGVVTVSNPSTGEIDVITGSLQGDEQGTNSNTYFVGDGLTGVKELGFVDDVGTQSMLVDNTQFQIDLLAGTEYKVTVNGVDKIVGDATDLLIDDVILTFTGAYADVSEQTEPVAPAANVGRFYLDPSVIVNDHPRLVLKDENDVSFDCTASGMTTNTYNTEAIGGNHYLALSGLNSSNANFTNRLVVLPRATRFYNMYVVVTTNGTTIVTNLALNDGAASPTVLDIDIPIGTTGTFANTDDFVDLLAGTEVAYGFGLTTGGTLAVASVGMAMDTLRLE